MDVSHAAPARRVSPVGLPRSWIGVGEIDPLPAEYCHHAASLTATGLDAALATAPGAPHGFAA